MRLDFNNRNYLFDLFGHFAKRTVSATNWKHACSSCGNDRAEQNEEFKPNLEQCLSPNGPPKCPKIVRQKKKKNPEINGKRFPAFERDSLVFRDSARKETHPPLGNGYGSSPCNDQYMDTYCKREGVEWDECYAGHAAGAGSKDSSNQYMAYCKRERVDWDEFYAGHAAGAKWISAQLQIGMLESVTKIESKLGQAAQKPMTQLNVWFIGFLHGALKELKTHKPTSPRIPNV
jgi:hypothetical protein